MMKKQLVPAVISILALALISLSCNISSLIVPATSTPTPTFTPSPTSTPTPTSTPEPMPDFSAAVLQLEDLPDGYGPLEGFDSGGDVEGYETVADYAFGLADPFSVIVGSTFYVPSASDQLGIDMMTGNPELMRELMAQELGGDDFVIEETIELGGVGDANAGFTAAGNIEGIDMKVDYLMLRRGALGVNLVVMYLPGQEPPATIEYLAEKIDVRLVAVLGQ